MEEDPFHHEKLADTLVKQTLAVAVGKNRLSSKFFKGVQFYNIQGTVSQRRSPNDF